MNTVGATTNQAERGEDRVRYYLRVLAHRSEYVDGWIHEDALPSLLHRQALRSLVDSGEVEQKATRPVSHAGKPAQGFTVFFRLRPTTPQEG